ncbi:MAG: hypothetical protein ABEJ57_00130 [Halobacteriaceae archaeon]
MRLADDDRGRVPFALIGVILLLASTGYAVTLGAPRTAVDRPGTTDAIRETVAATRTAVQGAIRRAAASAARTPVVTPANTTYGRVLDDDIPFRSWVRLRIAVAVRRAVTKLGTEYGQVHTAVSLPPITSPRGLRAAMRNVSIDRGNHTRPTVTVTIENIAVTASRDGYVVAAKRTALTVTVRTPAFVLHDRVAAFERRLNRSPFEPGLARQFTANLYGLTWPRGYAQYGGAPIENVVANRHLEVAANGALLAIQRAVFGTADRRGIRAHRRARLQTGVRDLLAAADVGLGHWNDAVLPATGVDPPDPGPLADRWRRDNLTVDLARPADDAFATFVDGGGSHTLSDILETVYTVRAQLATTTTVRNRSQDPADHPAGWTLTDTTTDRSTTVRPSTADPPSTPPGTVTLAAYSRVVTVVTHTTKTWTNGTHTRTTTGTERRTSIVQLAVHARMARVPQAPGALTPATRRGVLQGVASTILDRLVTGRGGVDTLAVQAATTGLDADPISIDIPRGSGVRDRVYRGVATLRRALQNRTVTVDPAGVTATPVTERLLAVVDTLTRDRLSEEGSYPSLAMKARVAARHAYVAVLESRLRDRGREQASVLDGFADFLEASGITPRHLGAVATFLEAPTPQAANPRVRISVAGVPAYLSRAEVGAETVPGLETPYYPLATRNRNLVTVPYGDAASAITDAVLDRGARVSLRIAARALRAANTTLQTQGNATIRSRRDALTAAMQAAFVDVETALVDTVHRRTPLPAARAQTVVTAALREWSTLPARVQAAANGSLAAAIATRVDAHATLSNRRLDRVRVRLRRRARTLLASTRIAAGTVTGVAEATRGLARQTLEQTVADTLDRSGTVLGERWVGDALGGVPGGVPLVPVPGYWYATANAWRVAVRGAYVRFAVAAPAGAPLDGLSGTVEYVRRSGAVRMDVDGDGEAELLGHNRRIRFAIESAVIIVVPPGGSGVADVDGVRDERSPGWNTSRSPSPGRIAPPRSVMRVAPP